MGCSSCGFSSSAPSKPMAAKLTVQHSNCDYTVELMFIWKEKLLCIKENNLYSEVGYNKYKINFALGTVQSAINTGNACYYKTSLDDINLIILSLINIGKC